MCVPPGVHVGVRALALQPGTSRCLLPGQEEPGWTSPLGAALPRAFFFGCALLVLRILVWEERLGPGVCAAAVVCSWAQPVSSGSYAPER